MTTIRIDKNAELLKGDFVVTFSALLFPDLIAKVIDFFKDAIGTTLSVLEDKEIEITEVYSKEVDGETKILIHFSLLKNPVPVGAIIIALLVVAGVFGAFLTFDEISQIIETPAGALITGGGVVIGIGIISLVLLFFLRKGK